MKALVLHNIQDIRLENVPKPVPKEGEVLVEVKAAGICGSDIPRIYRTGAYSYPLIPGHEFSGVVSDTGKGAGEEIKRWLGKRVGIFPLIPCMACAPCRQGQYEMCRHYSYLGSRRDGGFAEYAAVPAQNLIGLPDRVSFEEGAMLEPMAVAVHAMRKSGAKPSHRVVVCGLGTIGLLLLSFLLEAGITDILAVGNKEFQKRTACKLGLPEGRYFDAGNNRDAGSWILERTGGLGPDVFFECVGKNETVSLGADCTACGGTVMLVGNPYSDMKLEKNIYWKILRNQLSVLGTWNSSFGLLGRGEEDDWRYVIRRLSEKRISPKILISHKFPLDKLEQGFLIMRDKKEDYGKIIGYPGDEQ